MSTTAVSLHVRGVDRAALVAEVERGLRRRGLEPVRSPSPTEPHLVRVRLVAQGAWRSLAIEGLDEPDAWARALARALAAPTLGAWSWDGEGRIALALFEATTRRGRLALPEDARRAPDGRVAIPLGGLSRLVGGGGKKTRLEVLVRAEATFDEEGRCVHVPIEDAERALGRALGLAQLFLDPLAEDDPAELLFFRPAADSALAREEREARRAAEEERRADHEGRIFTVGWLAFSAPDRALAPLVTSTAGAVLAALQPPLGGRVLLARSVIPAARAEASLPPPTDGARAFAAYGRALRDGAVVALDHRETPLVASAWLARRAGALVVGWCLRGLRDPAKRAAATAAQEAIFDAAVADERCFGALLASQRSPMSVERQALAFEYLHGTSALALRHEAHRTRARAPGWRVLVPGAVVAPAPPGTVARAARAGLVIAALAPDPLELAPATADAIAAALGAALAGPSDARRALADPEGAQV